MYGERKELLDPGEWLFLHTGTGNPELTVPHEVMWDRVIGQAWSHADTARWPLWHCACAHRLCPALLKSPAQPRALGVLSPGPWTPQLIPGTVTADPPLQALQVLVLWVPHGTAPQGQPRFSAVGPRRSPGALDLCSADGSRQWLCAVYPAVSVPRQSS